MSRIGQLRADLRSVVLNLVANVIWLLLTVVSAAIVLYVTRSTDGRGLSATITAPAWLVLIFALIGIGSAIFVFTTSRKATVVRGREHATRANFKLLVSRNKLDPSSRVIRGTRFGRWPAGESLDTRTDFRQELDKAILTERADVKRIWNVSSMDDIKRLREVLSKYQGNANHSIRAYFGLADHLMPELLVVDNCGASISFGSTKTPHVLDWAVGVKRPDLIYVIKDYFEVLWDRAEKILDSGEITASGQEALAKFEARLTGLRQS